jgi:hypothetical protein
MTFVQLIFRPHLIFRNRHNQHPGQANQQHNRLYRLSAHEHRELAPKGRHNQHQDRPHNHNKYHQHPHE